MRTSAPRGAIGRRTLSAFAWCAALVICIAGHAQTVAISGLWDTGESSTGTALGSSTSVADPHWSLTATTDSSVPTGTTAGTEAWTTPVERSWASPTSSSTWIGPTYSRYGGDAYGNGNADSTYTFTMSSFSLPNTSVLSSAVLSGTLYADNNAEVFLNGTLLTLSGAQTSDGGFGTGCGAYQYGYETPLTFTTAGSGATFYSTGNVLTIIVANTSNYNCGTDYTGLLVTQLSGSAQMMVPEAKAFLPMAAALAFGAMLWRRSRKAAALVA